MDSQFSQRQIIMRKGTLAIIGIMGFIAVSCGSATATLAPSLPMATETQSFLPTNTPVPTRYSSPTPLPTPVTDCPDAPPIRGTIGQYVMISAEQQFSIRIRAQASLSAQVLDEARPGERLIILAGPICADNYVWWQVQVLRSGHPSKEWTTGWAAEGDAQERWLVSLPTETLPNLACKQEGRHWHCVDQVLNLEFKYPLHWGTIVKATLHAGECGGYGYYYSFDQIAAPRAEGLSIDFCVPRMGDSTSPFLRGFSTGKKDSLPADGCNLAPKDASYSSVCYAISKEVVLYILFPKPGAACYFAPDPGSIGREPIGIVVINTPGSQKVAGFSFVQRKIISAAMLEELYEPLGGSNASYKTLEEKCKDPAAVQESDRRLASIVERLTTRTADSETNGNLKIMDELAHSIQYGSP